VTTLTAAATFTSHTLLLTSRPARPTVQPIEEGALAIANGAADFHKRGAIAAHSRFCEPGFAQAQDVRCFANRQQTLVAAH
jgi:hypothetical protein